MNRIKMARQYLNMPINVMAKSMGLSLNTYQQLEDRPDQANAYLVYLACKILNVDFNSL